MIKSQGAVLKSILARSGPRGSLCPGRSVSTKSAIQQALKRSEYQNEGPRTFPARRRVGPHRELAQKPEFPASRERTSSRVRSEKHGHHVEEPTGRTSFRNREDGHSGYAKVQNDSLAGLDRKHAKSRRSRISNADSPHDSEWPRLSTQRENEAEEAVFRRHSHHGRAGRMAELEEESILRGRPPSSYQRSHSQEDEGSEPLTLPYTTPASEFLYGRSVVIAAMEAKRRKLYKLYIHHGPKRENAQYDMSMREMAYDRGIPVERVSAEGLRLMDRMSEGRPHNGYILEASPLPKLPVKGFERLAYPGDPFLTVLEHQSLEDEEVNGKNSQIKYKGPFSRFPFVLLIDGVLDPGNLGAIIRTAYFLGVDAVALTTNRSAPLSSVALKASAGASEVMPIVLINQTRSFLDTCKNNGWAIYSSDASASKGGGFRRQKHFNTSALRDPLIRHPCILLLGSEGQGLYKDVQQASDHVVYVEGHRAGEAGIDSLNVSVASGLLCEAFLRKPVIPEGRPPREDSNLSIRNRLF